MPIKLGKIPIDVKARLTDAVEKATEVPGVAAIWLFGSYARGNPTPLSDMDIPYLSQDALTSQVLDRLDHTLYRILSQNLEKIHATMGERIQALEAFMKVIYQK